MGISVLIIDDDELVRQGLCDWLNSIEGLDVVGDVANAEECINLVREKKPQIALVDVLLPGVSGIELVKELRKVSPDTRSVILSGSRTSDVVFDAFEAGAYGYLPKHTSSEELNLALNQVMEANYYLSPVVVKDILRSVVQMRKRLGELAENDLGLVLTDRERELLKLIAEGHTFAEIARHLSINARSVERLKTKLQEKLNADSLVDLIRQAIKMGIVRP